MTLVAAPNLARIPAGDFLMGASDADADERPVHRVTLGEFFIGRFPVTNDEYAKFIRATGHPTPSIDEAARSLRPAASTPCSASSRRRTSGRTDSRRPDTAVTRWCSFATTMRWRIARGRPKSTRRVVRLPTEAEWEKAARGGADGQSISLGRRVRSDCCSYLADASVKRQRGTRPTGTYPPNAYGLCDMIGNVWEWVSDWYDADYYGRDDHRESGRSARPAACGLFAADPG